ncbi:hypothetical protein G1K77_13370 [Tenacibaculum finnmarkense]|uniref:TIR domain-containing protein n=1 Tax=Tenacibaculum finnmarkense TaxID=2781243 RepID=UPI00187BC13C|nr:TIR domain-containing protein [Tenacibaculum finnmarkense]MBE7661529.1 hypothetical protein [Tenacibaculum finnmarkense genomovar finnmarkense]MCG8816761.1 hypothetical protein [Tenacibaculum finnmarkense]MCG8821750.1 hypothetical protein [Tenacibaculum finnmarkense]
MAKKKVIICFDYENDRHYRNLLNAWDANSDFEFSFNDITPNEIQSWNIPTVKGELTKKINQATYTLVLIGKEANKKHKDSVEIGYKNWQNFEISRSKTNRNKLVAIKLEYTNDSPDEIYGSGASWAYSFTKDAIIKALDEA